MKQESSPKISVIIPCYNVAPYLRAALNTVRFQTLTNFEAICVDDGSSDETGEILDDWCAKDSRFKVIHQKNVGVASARNRALDIAIGDYVAFLDPDDLFYDPNVLENLYNTALAENVEIVGGGVSRFINDGHELENGVTCFSRKEYIEFSDYQFDYGFYRFLFKRELIEENKIRFPSLTWYEDPLFFVQAAMAAGGFYAITEIVYRYRKSHKEIDWSANGFKKVNDLLMGLSQQLTFAKKHSFYKLEESIYNRRRVDFAEIFKACAERNPQTERLLGKLDALLKKERHMNNELQPKVSIVIPSLNSAAYYRECLTSIVSQTLTDIEIICVDAGSTDETLDILQEFALRDSRIKIVHSGKKSYGYQVNLGFNMANGEYLGILESDDYVDINMMKRLYEIALRENLDFIKSDMYTFTRNGNSQIDKLEPLTKKYDIYGRVLDASADPSLLELRMNNCVGIYRKKFLQENNIRHTETQGASFQDNGFWFRVFVMAKRVYFLDEAFYHIRRDNLNSSVKSKGKVYCMNVEYADMMDWLNRQSDVVRTRFMPHLVYIKFKAYNFTFYRIRDNYKFEYAMCMYGVFKDAKCAGHIDESLFDSWSLCCLNDLLSDPVGYAFRTQGREGRDNLKSLLIQISNRFSSISVKERGLVSSINPRGRNLLKRVMYCYKDNGLRYTIKRIFFGKQR